MKKIISTIAAAAMASTSISAFSALAVDESSNNAITVSTSVVNEATVVDGTVIPVGSTAVTVSIENNTGFFDSVTKLDVGLSGVILDSSGRPVIDEGELYSDACVSSVKNNNIVVVSSAAAEENTHDGEMFTFFLSNNVDDVTIVGIPDKSINMSSVASINTVFGYYIGDLDGDGYIDSTDASAIMAAYTRYTATPSAPLLTVAIANANISYYFDYVLCAEPADTNKNGKITRKDADNVLDFYSYVMSGYTEAQAYAILSQDDNYCSEPGVKTI